ncbi:MAG: DUF3592 domain-containing protein [Acidobacteriia bacterium]|nr:DUF3592 domain-containing protein [Terriglobia bacterium]
MFRPSDWTPPDGLGYTRARPVRLTAAGIALAVVGVALLLGAIGAAVGLGTLAGRQARVHRLLGEQGETADAVIARVWRSSGKDTTHWVAYRFAFQDREYEGRSKVPLRIWRDLTVGGRLPVRFVPSDPAQSHPAGWPDTPLPLWFPFVLAAVLALASAVPALALRWQARLLADGRAAPGVVTAHRRVKEGTAIRYEFTLPSGGTEKGRGGPRQHPPPLGGAVCVLYDPERPRRNAPYPLSLVKLARP